jgi:hypothetical protein
VDIVRRTHRLDPETVRHAVWAADPVRRAHADDVGGPDACVVRTEPL